MEIMIRFAAFSRMLRRIFFRSLVALAVCTLTFVALLPSTHAYVLNGHTWASGTVVLQMSLGSAGSTLSDGNTSWNSAAVAAVNMWNQQIGRVQYNAVMDSNLPNSSGDHVNSVVWANSVYGQSFGSGTLAVTYYMTQGNAMIEADVLFNRAQTFDSYRGSLRFGGNGYAIADIRRVFLHELGHGLGLQHQNGDDIMNPTISNRELLASDDIAGAQAMYGAAAPTPTPTPTPDPNTTPRLANISTRVKVGTGDEVLIGGFIISGSGTKQVLLRATGPSLTAAGVNGALQDPVLELHDSGGNLIAQNDDWQSGTQAAAISATGLAPTNPKESAILATLQSGSYTAIVQGHAGTTGIALVEGYEIDAPTTRLANLSTRGRIGVSDEVLIGGLIVQGSAGKKVIVRALGPSLSGTVPGTLADPMLELYNSSGQLMASNDNWITSTQAAEIAATLPPNNNLESAIVATLSPGTYTAIVRGVSGTTGIGLVEVYDLDP